MELAFNSFSDFIQMGNHGFYVWLCYGLTFATLVFNLVLSLYRKKQIRNEVAKDEIRKQKRLLNFEQNSTEGGVK